jgi:glycosyltransferase involved in cell wall biosynthesis
MNAKKPVSLSIFFPAYNEEDNIARAVNKTLRVVEESPFVSDYEIIIVDDGSSDGTLRIARQLSSAHPTVRVISHEKNKGYGAALKTGITSARMDYVFFTDADLQFDVLELQNLLLHIPEHQVVIGYRAPRRDPAMCLVNAWGWNKLNRFFFGLKVTDIDCAFKLFRRDLVQGLTLRSRGAMISAETLIRLKRMGATMKEIPVSHLPRIYGSPTGAKLSVIIRAFGEMVSLYRGELGSVGHKEIVRFMTVGVLNTLLDSSAYIILTRATLFSGEPVAAKFFSFLLGTVSSLMLNRYWTFGIRTKLGFAEVARFYATVSVSLALNVSAMYALVHVFGVYDLLALVLVTGITFAANYTLSKMWVFRPPPVRLARS